MRTAGPRPLRAALSADEALRHRRIRFRRASVPDAQFRLLPDPVPAELRALVGARGAGQRGTGLERLRRACHRPRPCRARPATAPSAFLGLAPPGGLFASVRQSLAVAMTP